MPPLTEMFLNKGCSLAFSVCKLSDAFYHPCHDVSLVPNGVPRACSYLLMCLFFVACLWSCCSVSSGVVETFMFSACI